MTTDEDELEIRNRGYWLDLVKATSFAPWPIWINFFDYIGKRNEIHVTDKGIKGTQGGKKKYGATLLFYITPSFFAFF